MTQELRPVCLACETRDAEITTLKEQLETERIRAAAVFFPLDGHHRTPQGKVEEGHFAWSPAYKRACEIRDRMTLAEEKLEDARKQLAALWRSL